MIYAITISVVTLFVTIYLLTKKKDRELHYALLNEKKFILKANNFASQTPLPSEGGISNAKKYINSIKFNRFLLKNKKYKGTFSMFCEDIQEVNVLLKADYSQIENLPSIDQEARMVKFARVCLAHSDYIFVQERVKTLFDEFNRSKTITFNEIMHSKEAFLYVLLEKLHYIYDNLHTLTKVYKIAEKYVKDDTLFINDKKFKSYLQSKLFISICAVCANYQGKTHQKAFEEKLDELYDEYCKVLSSMQCVLLYDFTKHYTPLEIFDKFDNFANATENQKTNLIYAFSKLSDKENLDEFMYAIRVEKYVSSASPSAYRVKNFSVFNKKICYFSRKNDISLIVSALKSRFFMDVFFSDAKSAKRLNSISKIIDFENTFEPFYKFSTINFGISTDGDVLRIKPYLPSEILSCSLVFTANGIEHTMRIEHGDDNKIYLGNTQIKGTRMIKLSSNPLDLLVVVKNKQSQK